MDTMNSFKGYGKVDPVEDQSFRQKTRKRILILSISIFLLIALIIGVVAGTLVHNKNKTNSITTSPTSANAIKSICSVTQYPNSCLTSLESSNSSDPETIFRFSLNLLKDSLQTLSTFPSHYINKTDHAFVKAALNVCTVVLNDAIESVNDSINIDKFRINDLETWLSTVITEQETCFDALQDANATFVDEIKELAKNSTELASNSLAIVSRILGKLVDFKIPIHRRLLSDLPEWVEGRILQESELRKPDVTVAKDGSGDVMTIGEAVAKVPKKSKTRFVIYVKEGEYVENVVMDKSFWNVTMYGDGKTRTIISGSKNFVDGTPTFETATFAIAGRGFIARDITFKNTAGPEKHQAVAFRSGSDLSVFYRCSFDGYQDTLYAHSNRQFYRDCDITGTIDFMFGNSAVVFQNCNIMPRQPMPNQFVTITAQGKKDINQNSGMSIQRCNMSPLDNLTAQTYLGRPWKEFSITVIMETNIGGFLNPKGWISWVSNVDPPSSIFYAEYQNTGPGANTSSRVTWAGYKPTLTSAQASKYNVQSLIDGSSWLPSTSVTFEST